MIAVALKATRAANVVPPCSLVRIVVAADGMAKRLVDK